MDEDDRAPAAQVRPYRAESFISQILVPRSVPRKQRDAVGVQLVERVPDLSQCALCIEEAGQSSEEAPSARVGVAEGGGIFICAPR